MSRCRLRVEGERSEDLILEYITSNDHRLSHDRLDPLLRRAIKLERLESMVTYDVVAE
jgi:hypothetical protein